MAWAYMAAIQTFHEYDLRGIRTIGVFTSRADALTACYMIDGDLLFGEVCDSQWLASNEDEDGDIRDFVIEKHLFSAEDRHRIGATGG